MQCHHVALNGSRHRLRNFCRLVVCRLDHPLDSRRIGSCLLPTCTGRHKKARGPKPDMFAEIRSSSADYFGKARD
jgi:hypothetical protein